MPLRSDEAIVLRTHPIGEADLVVTFLTKEEGKIVGVARSGRRSRKRFGDALAPLTQGTAHWSEREGRELVRLDRFDVTTSFSRLMASLEWFYLFAYVAEVADTLAREREPDERFFRLLRAASDGSLAGVPATVIRRWFELWSLRLHGLLPELSVCARCGRDHAGQSVLVAPSGGEAVCEACATQAEPSEETVRLACEEVAWIQQALSRPVAKVSDPGRAPGLAKLLRLLFMGFLGAPFRTARFLEAPR
jgi:DNA repair protein RecO (recombination protein O)